MGLAVILLLILIYYRSTPLEFQERPQVMAQKLETLSTLRINFLKSIEAEKLAVMAETDEASLLLPMNPSGRLKPWRLISKSCPG